MREYLLLNPDDDVGVALTGLKAGQRIDLPGDPVLRDDIPAGHKFAVRTVAKDSPVRKYGLPIGVADQDIPAGACVHVHNVRTNLAGEENYAYRPAAGPLPAFPFPEIPRFQGYVRPSGRVGIRNEVWIIPTVGCVNHQACRLAELADSRKFPGVERIVAFPHPYGCSQLGEDHENTRNVLANLARHPNTGGVLFIGLGCENNVMADFVRLVESRPGHCANFRCLIAQDAGDEIAEGLRLLDGIMAGAAGAVRTEAPVSTLCVGMKCGASDGLSGVTANPLLGAFSDWLVDRGGMTVLTEVPEMFGAERELLNRAANEDVFRRGVGMINDFKRYFLRHGQAIYENPSPGNKDGGITTLEDKSIGCVQKGGSRLVTDVLPYGGAVTQPGVSLLSGPGNDLVSVSEMAAAGAQIILFSTGRGNALGGPVPVIKVSSNGELARRKPHWIDYDASPLATGRPMPEVLAGLTELVLDVAAGHSTRSEENGFHDFAIFKDGVTL
ncbi:MAG: altronate dehydratase family protein [Planctomycetota bacterium]|jgi:altronate hydrolase|nr:altronate dehydratase family protein [Planctomycetota bacterium]